LVVEMIELLVNVLHLHLQMMRWRRVGAAHVMRLLGWTSSGSHRTTPGSSHLLRMRHPHLLLLGSVLPGRTHGRHSWPHHRGHHLTVGTTHRRTVLHGRMHVGRDATGAAGWAHRVRVLPGSAVRLLLLLHVMRGLHMARMLTGVHRHTLRVARGCTRMTLHSRGIH
jgi:hypothetical protein